MSKSRIAALLVAPLLVLGVSGCNVSSSNNAGGGGHHHKAGGNNNGGNSKSPKPTPHYTPSQEQAIGAAQDYLSVQGYSRAGLISQLSSKVADQFKVADATFAVNHIKVDWNAEAVQSAKDYLSIQHYSCQGLIGQLSAKVADQYTLAQAQYAAKKVGLC